MIVISSVFLFVLAGSFLGSAATFLRDWRYRQDMRQYETRMNAFAVTLFEPDTNPAPHCDPRIVGKTEQGLPDPGVQPRRVFKSGNRATQRPAPLVVA
ncbi:MAG: hypothetical protein AAGA28_15055 [Pseudomonadota bacterium]